VPLATTLSGSHPVEKRAYQIMAKAKVTFKTVRNSEDDWHIAAEYPGAEPREITGFKNKADVDDWMNGDRRVAWLRSQGYAK
jgi:hypothetical protein